MLSDLPFHYSRPSAREQQQQQRRRRRRRRRQQRGDGARRQRPQQRGVQRDILLDLLRHLTTVNEEPQRSRALRTLLKVCSRVYDDPMNDRYHVLDTANRNVQVLLGLPGVEGCLLCIGFERSLVGGPSAAPMDSPGGSGGGGGAAKPGHRRHQRWRRRRQQQRWCLVLAVAAAVERPVEDQARGR